jgi:hypothetical protein
MRYFFNLGGELPVDDPDGTELPDIESVRQHAISMAETLMRRTRLFRDGPDRWAVQVTDDDGHEVLIVPFREASAFAMNAAQQTDRAVFRGQLGWKTQLQLGKQMGNDYQSIANEDLPRYLSDLLDRLERGR